MNARLVVQRGGKRQVYPWRSSVAVFGRARGNTIRVPSAEVSRQHCRLTKRDGLVFVRDLGSVNGTLLNSNRIGGEEIVRPGDKLSVGPVTFIVEYELTPEALELLHGAHNGVDLLEGLADGDVVEGELELDPYGSSQLEALELVEAADGSEDLPLLLEDEPLPRKEDDLGLLPADFDFDAQPWELPAADDLRGLMDAASESETPPKKKPRPTR